MLADAGSRMKTLSVIPSITTLGLSRHTIAMEGRCLFPFPALLLLLLLLYEAFPGSFFRESCGGNAWFHQPSIRQLLPRFSSSNSPAARGGGLPTQANGSVTVSHGMTRAHPHDEPTPHRSTADAASSTTSRPIAGPPSPWPSRDCLAHPHPFVDAASTLHRSAPPFARLHQQKAHQPDPCLLMCPSRCLPPELCSLGTSPR